MGWSQSCISQIVSWGFGDAIFGTNYDNISSTIKLRRAGLQRYDEQGGEGKSRGAATGFSGSLPFYIRTRWLML
jgi:hypothetical protein